MKVMKKQVIIPTSNPPGHYFSAELRTVRSREILKVFTWAILRETEHSVVLRCGRKIKTIRKKSKKAYFAPKKTLRDFIECRRVRSAEVLKNQHAPWNRHCIRYEKCFLKITNKING